MPAYTYSGSPAMYPYLQDENGDFVGDVAAGDTRLLTAEQAEALGPFWHPAEDPRPADSKAAPPDAAPGTGRGTARSSKGEGK